MNKTLIALCSCLFFFLSCTNNNSKVEELEKKIEQQSAEMHNMEAMLEKELEHNEDNVTNNQVEELSNQTRKFQGAWFEIKYPSDFLAKGSLSSISSDGFDSATFSSPDNSVEFYVFSPQWGGEALDIALKSNEIISSKKSDKSSSRQVEWWTIEAKDKSYTRSYQKTTNEEQNTIFIIGLRYKNQESYNKYKKQYLAFKASLKQFAD